MTIQIEETKFSRMPRSINNHTDKFFKWNGKSFFIDKETDTFPVSYRLWRDNPATSELVLDYFCEGESWNKAIKFTEGFMTAKYGKKEYKNANEKETTTLELYFNDCTVTYTYFDGYQNEVEGDDPDAEHIRKLLDEGYIEGELHTWDGDKSHRGYWTKVTD